jgi:hypothetical protein
MPEPLYILRFRYVKPAKTLIKMEQKLAQIFLYTPASSKKNRIGNKSASPVLSARVPFKIFRNFLLESGWEEKDGILFTSREEPYYRAIIFAAVLQCTRDKYLMDEMYTLVKNLPYVDIKFWSKVFIEAFENRNWRRDLYKPVRAMKEVYKYA